MLKISQKEFDQLTDHIRKNYGISLGNEKKVLIIGRLHKVLENMGFENFSLYYNYLIEDNTGDRARELVDRITTNHTYFMREAKHFEFLKEIVLPYLKTHVNSRDLRIWSAACSSGQEPYTIAMIVDEYFGLEKGSWDTKILATDISDKVLSIGKKGVYPSESVAPLPPHYRLNYFTKLDKENIAIKEKLRNEVIFRKFNLMEEVFPFKKKFHIIFLRNVMIYFDNPTKDKLIEKMYNSLEVGGYLFIGHSEAINKEKSKFKYIRPAVYRK